MFLPPPLNPAVGVEFAWEFFIPDLGEVPQAEGAGGQPIHSTTVASPCPTPTHRVTKP